MERLSRHCVWDGMSKEVADWCRSCAVCAAVKTSSSMKAGQLRPLPVPERAWDSVSVDFTGPLPRTEAGHNSIMAIVDRLTGMLILKPCATTITGSASGKLLLDAMLSVGRLPLSIVSDRDVRFTGQAWGQLWRGLKTEQRMSTAYHPQTDGKVERANRTLQAVLRAYAESRTDWDEWLPFVAASYNSTVNETTGRTPFELNFPDGRAIDPLQWALGGQLAHGSHGVSAEAERQVGGMKVVWDEVRERILRERAKQKKYADRRRRDVTYEVGDRVWLSTDNLRTYVGKLADKWAGPYVVTRVMSSGASVELDLRGELGKTHNVFHVDRLKPYVESALEWPGRLNPNRPAPVLVDGDSEYEVERVIGKRVRLEPRRVQKEVEAPAQQSGGRVLRARKPRLQWVTEQVPVTEYLLLWRGWDSTEAQWKAEDDCSCDELIAEYELLQRQQREESGDATADAALELGLATAVVWRLAEKETTNRRGRPIVRFSCLSPPRVESGAAAAACGPPAGQQQQPQPQPAVVRSWASVARQGAA